MRIEIGKEQIGVLSTFAHNLKNECRLKANAATGEVILIID